MLGYKGIPLIRSIFIGHNHRPNKREALYAIVRNHGFGASKRYQKRKADFEICPE